MISDLSVDTYFESLSNGKIRVVECESCGLRSVTPRWFCPECGEEEWSDESVSPEGEVYTHTNLHVVSDDRFEPPLKIGIVELDAGPRLMVRLTGDVETGDRVTLDRVDEGQGRPVAVYRPLQG